MTTLDLDLVTLSGTFTDSTGAPRSGFVAITPEVRLVSTGADVVVPVTPKLVPLDAAGHFTVDLPATDDDKAGVTGWTYAVEVTFTGHRKPAETYHLSLPAAAVAVDLSDVVGAGRPSYGASREIVPLEVGGAVAEQVVKVATYRDLIRLRYLDTGELYPLGGWQGGGGGPSYLYVPTAEGRQLVVASYYPSATLHHTAVDLSPYGSTTQADVDYFEARRPCLELAFSVAVGGTFTLHLVNNNDPARLDVLIDGAPIAEDLTIPGGSYDFGIPYRLPGVELTAGAHVIQLVARPELGQYGGFRVDSPVLVRTA